MARGWQIRRVHQCHRVGLQARPLQQSSDQMMIDRPQPVRAHGLSKLMEHPGRGQCAPQPGEAPPRGLFGQLGHE